MKLVFKTYDSIAEMRKDALNRASAAMQKNSNAWSASSLGNETFDQTVKWSLVGNTALVPQAESLMNKLETQIEVPRRIWDRSPAGAFCSVPDYCSGLPTPMRRIKEIGDEHQPITILVRPNANASVDGQMLRQRGITVLSLVMALTRVRPVILWYYFCGDGNSYNDRTAIAAQINTAPLDLATACYVLTSAAYYRIFGMGLATCLNNFHGGPVISTKEGEDIAVKNMGLDPRKTLMIGPALATDRLLTQPIEWINEQVKRFTEINAEELT